MEWFQINLKISIFFKIVGNPNLPLNQLMQYQAKKRLNQMFLPIFPFLRHADQMPTYQR
jgi:hypothetical protein